MDPHQERELLASLGDAYMSMYSEESEYMKKMRAKQKAKRANGGNQADGERVEVKPEPKKPEFNAEPKKTKRLKTRGPRKGETFGIGARKRQGVSPPREDNPNPSGQKPNG